MSILLGIVMPVGMMPTVHLLYGDLPDVHKDIRYQLVTAVCATLLEAKTRGLKKAMLMVIVFKKSGCFSEEKVANNDKDIQYFLSHSHAFQADDYWVIPTKYGSEIGIEMYFSEIIINLN